MKKIWMMSLMLLAAGLLGFTWVTLAEAGQPMSYTLDCRAGGAMRMKWARGSREVRIVFRRSTTKSTLGLPAGTCAWPARSMNHGEQPILALSANGIPVQWVVSAQASSYVQLDSALARLKDAIETGGSFRVKCYNAGDRMVITQVLSASPGRRR